MPGLGPTDVSGKLDVLVRLLHDAERLAKELDGARINDWYGRPEITVSGATSMETRAQQVALTAHEVGRRMDLVAHVLRRIRPPGPVPPPWDAPR